MADQMQNPQDPKKASSIFEFNAKNIKGEVVPISDYKGHVCIIVNVASQCGLAGNNYKDLVDLHEQYGESKGLKILAFPCNQFGNQEAGNTDEICTFVSKRNVKFDMFEKVDVNGSNAHPLWTYLQNTVKGTISNKIKWNFTKFIVDKEGKPVERHSPTTNPKDLVKHLEKYF
ncbi:PREDICTED: probable phospholipid hydroperoxide glutathione peroxidase isoform X2 [Nicrophorus vespilloides]|nr:PREDICTED: probable phospholipid hydroperoxide glutathione peroxidase isoform X2 [Nicrophorus vespilloides]